MNFINKLKTYLKIQINQLKYRIDLKLNNREQYIKLTRKILIQMSSYCIVFIIVSFILFCFCFGYKFLSSIFLALIFSAVFSFLVYSIFYDKHKIMQNTIITLKDIGRPYVLNLDRSTQRIEDFVTKLKHPSQNLKNGLFFNTPFDKIRFRGTDGVKDLIFIDVKDETSFTGEEFSKNKNILKVDKTYKVYDKNEPECYILYRSHAGFYKKRVLKGFKNMKIGEFGCFLAHLRALNDIVKNNYEYGIIFEDDSQLDKNFQSKLVRMLQYAPHDAEMIKVSKLRSGKSTDWAGFWRSTFLYGYNKYFYNLKCVRFSVNADAYLVSNVGARKILDYVKHHELNVDDIYDLFLFMWLPQTRGFDNFYAMRKPLAYDRYAENISDIGIVNNINK